MRMATDANEVLFGLANLVIGGLALYESGALQYLFWKMLGKPQA